MDENTPRDVQIKEEEIDHQKFISMIRTSEFGELTYYALIPEKIFAKQTQHILILEVSLVVIFISLLLVGLWLIHKNYNHMIALIKKFALYAPLMKEREEATKQTTTEFGYIESIFDSLWDDVHKQKIFVLENIMGSALNNMVDRDIEKSLQKYEDLLLSNQFLIGVIQLEEEEYEEAAEKKIDAFMIHNVIGEVLEQYAKVYLIAFHDSYALIINLGQEVQEETTPAIMQELQRGKDFLEEKMDLRYTLCLSGMWVGIRQFSVAYNEAHRGIAYHMIRGKREIIDCTKLYGWEMVYQYSSEVESQLIAYIKTGDTHKALVTIEYLFDVNFSQNQLSIEGMEGFFFDLYSTLMKIAKEHEISIAKLTSKSLKKMQSLDEIKQMLEEAIQSICTHMESKKQVMVGEQSQQIIAFNSSYVSRMFKEQTGGNLLTYINSYRVERIKQLLATTDFTLNEIADQVGFLNSTAIIRTFKKYEGMTTIQYRTIHRELHLR